MSKLRRAFTITELVIVIAVIAILAAVLIPTFASVIDNAKKSHDDELVKEINIALSAYNAETGKNPSNYEELMLVLSDYKLTDSSNPFLLAEGLQQDNVYLIWYQDANAVVLVDTANSDYVVTFTSSVGLGTASTFWTQKETARSSVIRSAPTGRTTMLQESIAISILRAAAALSTSADLIRLKQSKTT